MHDGAPALGQVREAGGAGHVEGQPPGVDVRGERREQRDLGLERGAGGGVLRRAHDPAAARRRR